MGSFNLQHWTRIGAMNRNEERGCVRSTSRSMSAYRDASEFFRHAVDCACAAAGPLDTAAVRGEGSWRSQISGKRCRFYFVW